ncbi:S41 family peptidase [uncultured Flavobacterium sp.]|uniref:S41 family peptidase n=1 Tax=uncultured Flavobacterium sp. TaxID=165435 RepID=UPI0030CA5B14|tara:strand:+ start:7325 stop:8953 length:1629 start_codon:yes stop_codon:yes gene_type:complete
MKFFLKKRIIIPIIAISFLCVGASFKGDFFEIAKQLEIFTNLFKLVNQNYVDETNPGDMMDKGIKSMLKELDPYTVFFNEQDVIKFKINNTGEYTGIGAMVSQKEDKLILKEVYKNFSADKAGLKAGDQIIQIEDILLKDFKEDASQLLKGAKNTKIDIVYLRQGQKKKGSIILDEVELKAVPYYKLLENNTGYIVLSKFNEKAAYETKSALLDLKKQGATKIILDLRANPGGLLDQAVSICNLFVPKNETIVTTKSKVEKYNSTYKTKLEPVDLEIPLAIIVNGQSASASEIVAGALQDLDRAVVVGNRSFGKGLVQRPLNMPYGTQVKVTISKYYTPSGRCIQALDYSHKGSDGKAIRTTEKNYNAFKTKNGRTVYDGGGIMPDIEVLETKSSSISKALTDNDAIFNYATAFYFKNQNNSNAMMSSANFDDFKQFVQKNQYKMNTKTELALENTLEVAKAEKIDQNILSEYKMLKLAVEKSNEKDMDKNKAEILMLLNDEIITRFKYKEGLYDFDTQNNAAISKAKEIVNNTTQYYKIRQ